MKISWLITAIVLFVIGLLLTFTIIGAIIGIPLIIISIVVFVIGIFIPGMFMRKIIRFVFKIAFIILIIMGVSLFFDIGKGFWYDKVITPVLKPFSEECGMLSSLPTQYKKMCACEGTLLNETLVGSINQYCYGQCGKCTCYNYNQTISEYQEVPCVN